MPKSTQFEDRHAGRYAFFVALDEPVVLAFFDNPPALRLGGQVVDRPTAIFPRGDIRALSIYRLVAPDYIYDKAHDGLESLSMPPLDTVRIHQLVADFLTIIRTDPGKVKRLDCIDRSELTVYGSKAFPSLTKIAFIKRRDGRYAYQLKSRDAAKAETILPPGSDTFFIRELFIAADRKGIRPQRASRR